MNNIHQAREPKGSPGAGQWAPGKNAESSDVNLSAVAPDEHEIQARALEALQAASENDSEDYSYIRAVEDFLIPGNQDSGWGTSAQHLSSDNALSMLQEMREQSDSSPQKTSRALDAGVMYGGEGWQAPPPEVRTAMLDLIYHGQDDEHRAETEKLMDLSNRMLAGPEASGVDYSALDKDDLETRAHDLALEGEPGDSFLRSDPWKATHMGLDLMISERVASQVDLDRQRRRGDENPTRRQP